MHWGQLGNYLYNHRYQVMSVRAYGFCILNTIDLVLYCNYNEVATVNSQQMGITFSCHSYISLFVIQNIFQIFITATAYRHTVDKLWYYNFLYVWT